MSTVWVAWILNTALDRRGGQWHERFLASFKWSILYPPVIFGFLIYIASRYGTEEDVALGTDWSMTRDEDANFTKYYWPIFFMNIGWLLIRIRKSSALTEEFLDGEYLDKISRAGCTDEYGNPKQCTVEDDQATWGTICIDGYTLDAMPCGTSSELL